MSDGVDWLMRVKLIQNKQFPAKDWLFGRRNLNLLLSIVIPRDSPSSCTRTLWNLDSAPDLLLVYPSNWRRERVYANLVSKLGLWCICCGCPLFGWDARLFKTSCSELQCIIISSSIFVWHPSIIIQFGLELGRGMASMLINSTNKLIRNICMRYYYQ